MTATRPAWMRGRPMLAWALALALVGAWTLWRTPVVTDISAFLPGAADRTQALLAAQLRDGIASRTLLVGLEADGADRAALAARAVALAGALRADARFEAVADADPSIAQATRRVVSEHRYLLAETVNAEAFTVEGLRAALDRLADALQSSVAPLVASTAAEDPTQELLRIAERFADRPQPASYRGAWLDAEGRTALMALRTRAPGHDIDGQQDALAALRRAFEATAGQWPAGQPQPRLLVTGSGAFAVASREAIERDATRLSAWATVAIGGLLLVALRRWTLLPLAALPVTLGALAGFVAVAWTFGSVHGITIGFGMTLIGEAVDYAIYVFLQRSGTTTDARLWRSLWLAVLTSSVGFVAMIVSGFQGLAQLGLFSVVGIVAAGAVARWVLPAWLPAGGAVAPAAALARAAGLLEALPRLRWPLAALAMVLGGLVALRGPGLWNDELGALSPLPERAGRLDQRLREALGLPDLRHLLAIDGDDRARALERAERARPLLEALCRDRVIAGYDSPAAWLPSPATQAARRAALPDAATLRARLAQAVAGSPFQAGAFEPFVAAVERARTGPPLEAGAYADTAIGAQLALQLVESDGRATALIALRGVSDPVALRARVDAAALPGLVAIDLKADLEALIGRYRRRALGAAGAGMLAIVALLAWRVRQPGAALRIAAALACAVAVTAGAVTLIDGRLTLFHLVSLLLVTGIGSNYALFFATRPPEASSRVAVQGSVLLCATSTFIAFGCLAAASAPVLHIIGLTVGIGTLASLAAAAAIAPADSRGPLRAGASDAI